MTLEQRAGKPRPYEMYELHQHEQYFWDDATIARLADFIAESGFVLPCCLCCPMLGRELARRGIETRVLDCDERFDDVRGFQKYDVFRPTRTGESYGIIICDPPFFGVSLSQLFRAIRVLANHAFTQPLMIFYLSRRAQNVTGTFANFNLQPTGWKPIYKTVQRNERNEIQAFSNFDCAPLCNSL